MKRFRTFGLAACLALTVTSSAHAWPTISFPPPGPVVICHGPSVACQVRCTAGWINCTTGYAFPDYAACSAWYSACLLTCAGNCPVASLELAIPSTSPTLECAAPVELAPIGLDCRQDSTLSDRCWGVG